MTKTAYIIGQDNTKVFAHLFPAYEGSEYVRVSAASGETYIFPTDENGEVVSWRELAGSVSYDIAPLALLRKLGYDIYEEEYDV